MSFSSILNSVDQYIKEGPWLQFVGYMVAFGGLVTHHPVVTYVGLGVSMAGWLYKKIYP
jgi:hypothetical protein